MSVSETGWPGGTLEDDVQTINSEVKLEYVRWRAQNVTVEGGVDQRQIDEIKARYGIGGRTAGPRRFPIVLIRPSRYDDDGYVIQWFRSAAPSEALTAIRSLVEDCVRRKVLGDEVQVDVRSIDEDNTRIRTDRLARELKDGKGLVILVGVQSNQFSRAMDIALSLRVGGVLVCMGGDHVSGSIAAYGGVTPELQEAVNMGVSLFAGEAKGERLDPVLHDAWRGELKPLYNYLDDLRGLEAAPATGLQASAIRGTIGKPANFDALRGPVQVCFSTIVDEQGGEWRRRTVDEVEQIVRQNLKQGAGQFFITDESFGRNPDWERVFDRLIAMREQEQLNIEFTLQVDATCHRLAGFIGQAGRAGVRRVSIRLERIHPQRLPGEHSQNPIADYRKMLLEWKRVGAIVFGDYPVGLPGETRESVLAEVRTMKRELAIDLLAPRGLTASEDHPSPHGEETGLDADLRRDAWKEFYTLEHMETVLRRAAATGIPLEEMMALLLWFHWCTVYEKIDPLQGGNMRRKHRLDRRPTMPKEGWLGFWTRYGWELAWKRWKRMQLDLRFRSFTKRLQLDRSAKGYRDLALTPDVDTESSAPEIHPHSDGAVGIRPAV